nr:trehalase-like domain-containing protein [Actinacidiphila yanglinensis]
MRGPGQSTRRPEAHRSLRDDALIADGECGALVGPQDEWMLMCAPRRDSEAVFSGPIGGQGVSRGRRARGSVQPQAGLPAGKTAGAHARHACRQR